MMKKAPAKMMKKSPAKMGHKKAPAKMMKKSPAKKALVGKQKNLPKELREKILASPAKMLKPAAMKLMKKDSPAKKRVVTKKDGVKTVTRTTRGGDVKKTKVVRKKVIAGQGRDVEKEKFHTRGAAKGEKKVSKSKSSAKNLRFSTKHRDRYHKGSSVLASTQTKGRSKGNIFNKKFGKITYD